MIRSLNVAFLAVANDTLDAVVSSHSLFAGQRFWSKLSKGSSDGVGIGGELIVTNIPSFIGLSAIVHSFLNISLIVTKVRFLGGGRLSCDTMLKVGIDVDWSRAWPDCSPMATGQATS